MINKPILAFVSAMVVVLSSGCASRTKQLSGTPENPFEISTKEAVTIGYKLDFYSLGVGSSGYRLTIQYKNLSSAVTEFVPDVILQDASGLVIAPMPYGDFLGMTSRLLGTRSPPMPPERAQTYFSGTTRNLMTGDSYQVSGTIREQKTMVSEYERTSAAGSAFAASMVAAANVTAGRDLLEWGEHQWLQSSYRVPPSGTVQGVVFFPAQKMMTSTLTIHVASGSTKFTFFSKPLVAKQ